jgi:hypothetical protein
MSSLAKQMKIDELLEKAGVSFSRGALFECERMAAKALLMARAQDEFARMIEIARLLQQTRGQRLQLAMDTGAVVIFNDPVTDGIKIQPGCYLFQPPMVGADARRLRLAAFQNEVPVAVICREPLTQLKLCPVVAICTGWSLRTRIKPPKNPEQPDLEWFAGAIEALGECAIESIDHGVEVGRRIDAVLECLDALPEHAGLHDTLIELCRGAIDAGEADGPSQGRGRRKRQEAGGTDGDPDAETDSDEESEPVMPRRRRGRKRKLQP